MAKTDKNRRQGDSTIGPVSRRRPDKKYYYIDIDTQSRRIIGWGVEKQSTVEVTLSPGYHRTFLSPGQYNKLVKELEAGI